MEKLLRTAIFKPAAQLIGQLLQEAADRIDAAYQPKPGEIRNGRSSFKIQGIFGFCTLLRDYYYHPGKCHGHPPADDALGLEGAHTPAPSRLICLEGSDESSYQKAFLHLAEIGGISIGERQVQREVLRLGPAAAIWQRRESLPEACDATVLYIEADYTGLPMRREELVGRKGFSSTPPPPGETPPIKCSKSAFASSSGASPSISNAFGQISAKGSTRVLQACGTCRCFRTLS